MKVESRYFDACQSERKESIRCLETIGSKDKQLCTEFFEKYKECKKKWVHENFHNK